MLRHLQQTNPALIAWLGGISGWFSVENLSRAATVAQLLASIVAALVSLCALILTAPKAYQQIKTWLRGH